MPDEETESYRVEQGKPPRTDPRDRQGEVPLAFSTVPRLRNSTADVSPAPRRRKAPLGRVSVPRFSHTALLASAPQLPTAVPVLTWVV